MGIVDEKPNDEFFQDVAANGYFIKIGPATQTHYSYAENYSEFSFEVVFYFPIPSKSDFDFLNVEDMVFKTVRNALGLHTNYPNSVPPKNNEIEGPTLLLDIDSPTGIYRYRLEYFGD